MRAQPSGCRASRSMRLCFRRVRKRQICHHSCAARVTRCGPLFHCAHAANAAADNPLCFEKQLICSGFSSVQKIIAIPPSFGSALALGAREELTNLTYTVCVRSVVMLTLAMMSAAQVRAQSLPSPWTAADVGAPALSGSAAHAAGTFTVDAAGVDIWGSKDEFHFVYQQIAGDVQVIARVQSVTNQHAWSK